MHFLGENNDSPLVHPTVKLKADFKIAVDRYLSTVSDQPTTNTCTSAHRAAHNNSYLIPGQL